MTKTSPALPQITSAHKGESVLSKIIHLAAPKALWA
jgi:hypothetical protein